MDFMFNRCYKLKQIKGINYFKNTKVTNMKGMFQDCIELEELDLTNFNTSNANDISFMFNGCHNLKTIIGIGKFNTFKVNKMNSMFQECKDLEEVDLSNFNTSNVVDISYMFNNCNKLNKIVGIYNFYTINVTKMQCLFQECHELEYLDLSNFNTSNVIDMSFMFNQCYKLIEIKGIILFDTTKVTNFKAMFQQCNSLNFLNLSNFKTPNIIDMSYMFNKCNKLKEIEGISNFETKNVINMKAMFQECNELEYLDLFNFDTSNVTDMSYMFNKCNKLKKIIGINNFNINNVDNMDKIFHKCTKLEDVDLSKFNEFKDKKEFKPYLNEVKDEKINLKKDLNLGKKNYVIFVSEDKNINFSVSYRHSDVFSKLEKMLYFKFPNLKYKNISFFANEKEISRNCTLKQNEIKNGDIIIIKEII